MTNFKAYFVVIFMAVVVLAVVAIAIAAPAGVRGDPPMTGSAGRVGSSGSGSIVPGGITDDAWQLANTDGSWSAKLGSIVFSGLTEGDVGTVLWQGSRISVEPTSLADYGVATEVCEPFPEIELAGGADASRAFETHIRLELRHEDCSIVLADVQRSYSPSPAAAVDPMRWFYGRHPRATGASTHPIAWTNEPDVRSVLDWLPTPPSGIRFSNARSKLRALDGFGFMLTQAEIRHRYEPSTMTPLGVTAICEADSPAFLLGVTWHEDECSPPSQTTSDGSLVYSRARGRFHGETMPSPLGWIHPAVPFVTLATLVGQTQHTHRATLRGYAYNEYYSCLVSPSSAMDITARLVGLFDYSSDTECNYRTYIW